MHKSTVNRIVKKVTRAICGLAKKYIKLPVNAEEIANSKEAFYETARFPNVVGVIDCTHIKITSPGGNDAEVFRNRKSYFSINVQAVADMTIFNNSVLKAKFENNEFPNCFLLRDGGYALKNYLLTPLLETRNDSENNYNNAHKKTRVLIENTFGILKRRFPVLAYGCRTRVDLTLNIIVASAILHNIAREANTVEPLLEVENEELFQYYLRLGDIPLQAQDRNFINNENNANGFNVRNELIQNYFQHLN